MPGAGPLTRSKGRRPSQNQELFDSVSLSESNCSQTAGSLNQQCMNQLLNESNEDPKVITLPLLSNPHEGNNNTGVMSTDSPGTTMGNQWPVTSGSVIGSCSSHDDTEQPESSCFKDPPVANSSSSNIDFDLNHLVRVKRVSSVTEHFKSLPCASNNSTSQGCAPSRVMRCPVSTKPIMRTSRFQRPISSKLNPFGSDMIPLNNGQPQNETVVYAVPSCSSLQPVPGAFQPQASNIPTSSSLKVPKPSKTLSGTSMGLLNSEPEVLKCRSGLSSYSLRVLKTVPWYSEKWSVSRPQSMNKRRARNNQLEAMNDRQIWISENKSSPIHSLPDELLCEIFSFLPQLDILRTYSKVCHRWHNISRSPPLWQKLSFSGPVIPFKVVDGLIRLAAPYLKSITLKDRGDADLILPLLHQQCKRLENVNLVRCSPCDAGQRSLRAKFLYPFLKRSQLRSLNLKGTNYKSRKFYQLLSKMPHLKTLNISCCRSVTPQILSEIAKHTNLKVFKNKWHSDSKYHGSKSMTIQLPGKIDEWSTAYHLLFQNAGKSLTTLEFYAAGINDSALSGLASCKNLKKLSVFNANCFGSESISAVGSLPNLLELLIHNAKITTTELENAFQAGNLGNLKCLHLNDSVLASRTDVSADNCLETIAQKCQFLQHLSFTKCSSLTDTGVKYVLTSCPALLSLDVYGCPAISGQSFLLIPSSSPRLKLLVIEENCPEEKKSITQGLSVSHGIITQTASTWKQRTTPFYL